MEPPSQPALSEIPEQPSSDRAAAPRGEIKRKPIKSPANRYRDDRRGGTDPRRSRGIDQQYGGVGTRTLWLLKVPKGEDLVPFATGVLARNMIGKQGDR